MPSYTAHTIMARDVYKKLKNKKDVSLDYMLTYSLGGDLTNFAKCRHTSHNKNREEWERKTWKLVQNYMGRTSWDEALSAIMHTNCKYFHVEEALRTDFFDTKKKTKKTE